MSVSSGLPLVRIALSVAWTISPRSSRAVNNEARASGATRRTSSPRSCTGTAHPGSWCCPCFWVAVATPKLEPRDDHFVALLLRRHASGALSI